MIVLDTAALIFWTIDRPSLSPAAELAIANAQEIVISSISIWEIALKARNGKLAIPLPIYEYVELLKQASKVQITPVTEEIWLKNVELAWAHKDPANRTIVATASLLDYPLLSPDRHIRAFYAATVW